MRAESEERRGLFPSTGAEVEVARPTWFMSAVSSWRGCGLDEGPEIPEPESVERMERESGGDCRLDDRWWAGAGWGI